MGCRKQLATKREEFLKQLMSTFRLEGEEHIQKLTEGLLGLEQGDPNSGALIESIYREAHSLKGAARAVNLRDIETVCQAMEGVLACYKRGDLLPERESLNLLHRANDLVGRLIASQGESSASDLELIEQLINELENLSDPKNLPDPNRASPPPSKVSIPVPNAEPAITAPNHNPISEVTSENQDGTKELNESNFRTAIKDDLSPTSSSPESPKFSIPETAPLRLQTVRVDPAQLDFILRQSEELVGIRLSIEQRAEKTMELYETSREWSRRWKKLAPALRKAKSILKEQTVEGESTQTRLILDFLDWLENEQSRLIWLENQLRETRIQIDQNRRALGLQLENLRGGIRQTLMLSFSHLVASFPKMVRDLAQELNKQVDFSIEGDQVQADKRILEALKDPLMHLIRNSLDHGIETPDLRRSFGKPLMGKIVLSINQIGNGKIEVGLCDDGQGLNPEKLRNEAIRKKFLTSENARALSDQQVLNLIFDSGFSTSTQVTSVSGRGLGMAIVREKIEALGGELGIDNRPGIGITFRMILPTSMATTRGILVQSGGRIFCVPTNGVERVIRFRRESINFIQGLPTTNWQGQCIGYVSLDKLLGLSAMTDEPVNNKQLIALLIEEAGEKLALGVDRVVGEQEVLVKNLGSRMARLPNFSGTTVLGTGELIPILHLPDIIHSARLSKMQNNFEDRNPSDYSPVRVLVADDSVTTRTLIKIYLEDAGFEVKVVPDGAEALDMLNKHNFNLLVSDVEMPNMTGLELCQAIRNESSLKDLPVILCSSLGSDTDRKRGLDSGASAYLVKRDLDQDQLLKLISQLI